MSESTPPRWRTQLGIGTGLIVIAVVIWLDSGRLPPGPVLGVGPAAAMKLVSAFVAILGIAHWVVGLRQRAHLAATGGSEPEPDRGNHVSLGWVFGALLGLIVILQFGGGFMAGSTWLFVGTARGFGEKLSAKSIAIGAVLSVLVYLFFTKGLSLALPAGPLERLLG